MTELIDRLKHFANGGAGPVNEAVEGAIAVIEAITKDLERSYDLRAKIEVQSMQAMDQLRAQIRSLGADPVL